jgi:2-amino-4-hydroxy-6-hydroxymethyldihydropteridine diphosphokinase
LLPPAIYPQRQSQVYETEPLYLINQSRYYNAACRATTLLSPADALNYVKLIEARMGRVSGPRYSPRIIDIDILFYSQLQMTSPELTIPHPRLPERAFVLAPMIDIAPDFKHPGLSTTVIQMLSRLPDWRSQVRIVRGITL